MTININAKSMPPVLFLGRSGETDYRTISIDISSWLDAYPAGGVSAVFQRPDGMIYPVAAGVISSPLTWTLNAADTVAGDGKLELRITTPEGMVGKSAIIPTRTAKSLGDAGSIPDPPDPGWITTVAQNAALAQESKNAAEAAQGKAEDAQTGAEAAQAAAEAGAATAVNTHNADAGAHDERFAAKADKLATGNYTPGNILVAGEGGIYIDSGYPVFMDVITDPVYIQNATRKGTIRYIADVGDSFEVSRGSDILTFDFIGFDADTPADPQFTHSTTVQLHNCYKNMQFDAPELLFYVNPDVYPSGLAAGIYNFTLDHGAYGGDTGEDGTYQFTTTQPIPAGGRLTAHDGGHISRRGRIHASKYYGRRNRNIQRGGRCNRK